MTYPQSRPLTPDNAPVRLTAEQQVANALAVLECSQDAIFTTNLHDVVLSWNPAAEQIYGYSAEEILGRNASAIVPLDRECERQDVLKRLLAHERISTFDTKRLRKDGSTVDVAITVSPLRDVAGSLTGLLTIARDISEQKAAESALQQNQRELHDYFENAVIALHWVGPDGTILWANKAEMQSLGYMPEEYIGHHIAEFHADRDAIDDILQRLGRNEKLHGYEARLRCKDGSIKHVLISSSVLWDEQGRFVHTRCFTLDVTQRKLAEEVLRRTEKMAATGRLAASIAHEINNPLEAVMNLLYLARNQAVRPDVIDYLDAADGELKRVSYIARRTLAFFKDRTDHSLLRLDTLVDEVVSLYRGRLGAREIVLEVDLVPVCVTGYEGELRQVVSNLLLNAIEASNQHGRIAVRVRRHGLTASCVIADRGTGIACTDRNRIFEPFFTTKKDTGTGLGLWVSQEIARKHRGRIAFRTSSLDGSSGTVFRLTLPATAQSDSCGE